MAKICYYRRPLGKNRFYFYAWYEGEFDPEKLHGGNTLNEAVLNLTLLEGDRGDGIQEVNSLEV